MAGIACKDKKSVKFAKKTFIKTYTNYRNYSKVRDHCHCTGKHRGNVDSIFNLRYNIQSKIHLVFHSGLKYHYHFIIKELANEFKGEINRLGENTEK